MRELLAPFLFAGIVTVASAPFLVLEAKQSLPLEGTLQRDVQSNTDMTYYTVGNDLVIMVRASSETATALAHLEGKQVSLVVTEGQ